MFNPFKAKKRNSAGQADFFFKFMLKKCPNQTWITWRRSSERVIEVASVFFSQEKSQVNTFHGVALQDLKRNLEKRGSLCISEELLAYSHLSKYQAVVTAYIEEKLGDKSPWH